MRRTAAPGSGYHRRGVNGNPCGTTICDDDLILRNEANTRRTNRSAGGGSRRGTPPVPRPPHRGLAGRASSTPATHLLMRANVMTLHDPSENQAHDAAARAAKSRGRRPVQAGGARREWRKRGARRGKPRERADRSEQAGERGQGKPVKATNRRFARAAVPSPVDAARLAKLLVPMDRAALALLTEARAPSATVGDVSSETKVGNASSVIGNWSSAKLKLMSGRKVRAQHGARVLSGATILDNIATRNLGN